jgi:hypothetical protein
VIPSHLIELGQQALAAVATNAESGAPLVKCQLLASEFYEALKRELQVTSQLAGVCALPQVCPNTRNQFLKHNFSISGSP